MTPSGRCSYVENDKQCEEIAYEHLLNRWLCEKHKNILFPTRVVYKKETIKKRPKLR